MDLKSDDDIFEKTISNVNFVKSKNGILLFIYYSFELNVDEVRFYLEEDKLMLHYPSDLIITIPIENEEIYQELKKNKLLRVFEVDLSNGEVALNYNATK